MISEQLDSEFSVDHYDDIKKVYSIWICTEAPEKYANTTSLYSMKQENIYGQFSGEELYDLLSVVVIRLSKKENAEKGNKLHQMLTVLLSHKLSVEEKKEILQTEYNMIMTKKMTERGSNMSNLGVAIREEATLKGISKAMINSVNNLQDSLECSLERACELLKITLEEYNEAKRILDDE